jgi:dTDP-4-amino-4,6-dideoxygalactose transaminase
MIAIQALSNEYGFRIIEDACHALGGQYKGEPIGNCRYSNVAVFSFHPVKSITTAEGGMAVTNDRFWPTTWPGSALMASPVNRME